MTISMQHVLASFQGSLGLNMRILREIYNVRSLELAPNPASLLGVVGADGAPVPLRLNCDNAITPYTIVAGCWQPEEYAFVQRTVAPLGPFALIDIGANVGLFSRQCAAKLANCRRVFAYEPDANNFALLGFNLAPFADVECHPVALADAEGESTYFLDPENSGNYSLNAAAMPEVHATGTLRCIDAAQEAERWLASGLPLFYKSDTQGFDEKIATRIDLSFWSRVVGGIMEVWQISKPEFDTDKLRAILDQFPYKCLLTEPGRLLTTAQVIEFAGGAEGKSGDLGFWR